MKKLLFLLLLSNIANAQITIIGKVSDNQATLITQPGIYAQLIPGNIYTEITNGQFEFKGLQKGPYRINISAIGYKNFSKSYNITNDTTIVATIENAIQLKDEVVIYGSKNLSSFTSVQTINKQQIEKLNIGQDIPYLMQQMTSVNVSSDAGGGVGYTNMSVRGSDATRINVTLNGIPLNDAESHGAFWVNVPDFASSAQSIALQKGIGASTNGVAAFGANLNVQTNTLKDQPYAELNNSFGSFNTLKNTLVAGTGLINNQFTLDMRLSQISSDGYIDRATSSLKSYFVSAGWYGKNSILKFNHFAGKEKTYQAWNGVPQDSLATNRTYNEFNYANQTDNYEQQHEQLFYSYSKKLWLLNAALHYTKGGGYYEEYKGDELFSKYGLYDVVLNSDTIYKTDLIRQRWLDNQFYGGIWSITKNPNFNADANVRTKLLIGGGFNQYKGNHFGEVIWAKFASNSTNDYKYYNDKALKNDFNQYLKFDVYLPKAWTFFADLQYRNINYSFEGYNELFQLSNQQVNLNFFNPKIGIMRLERLVAKDNGSTTVSKGGKYYAFYGYSSREPVRSDYVNSTFASRPKPERMHNVEVSYETTGFNQVSFKANYYMQYYLNQLVLTGQINDVGAYTRKNVDKSYRSGLELELNYQPIKKIRLAANGTFSQNKILDYTDFVDNYDLGTQAITKYAKTNIAFSPNYIAGAELEYNLFKSTSIALFSKFVGKQYLDNTSNENRKLKAYNYFNIRVAHEFNFVKVKAVQLSLMVNNLFNSLYEANGYTYSYIYANTLTTQNYYFPQAGVNFMFSLNIKIN